MTKISTWVLVPARAGSKGVPNKNIRKLGGHALLAYSVRAGLLARSVDRVIVSTDSEEYAEIARSYGADTPFIRPAEHADDQAGDDAVVGHLMRWLAENGEAVPDLIAYLRPTAPLRDPGVVDAAVAELRGQSDATSLRSIHPMSETAYKTLEFEDGRLKPLGMVDGDLDTVSAPRQGFPVTYFGNGYVDVFRGSRPLDGKPLYGDQVAGFMTDPISDIDTVSDFEYLEYQIEKQPKFLELLFRDV